jgi:hypothetical protein
MNELLAMGPLGAVLIALMFISAWYISGFVIGLLIAFIVWSQEEKGSIHVEFKELFKWAAWGPILIVMLVHISVKDYLDN